jgi:hypothetical protein
MANALASSVLDEDVFPPVSRHVRVGLGVEECAAADVQGDVDRIARADDLRESLVHRMLHGPFLDVLAVDRAGRGLRRPDVGEQEATGRVLIGQQPGVLCEALNDVRRRFAVI